MFLSASLSTCFALLPFEHHRSGVTARISIVLDNGSFFHSDLLLLERRRSVFRQANLVAANLGDQFWIIVDVRVGRENTFAVPRVMGSRSKRVPSHLVFSVAARSICIAENAREELAGVTGSKSCWLKATDPRVIEKRRRVQYPWPTSSGHQLRNATMIVTSLHSTRPLEFRSTWADALPTPLFKEHIATQTRSSYRRKTVSSR